jgi:hypothetical protein
MVIDERGQHGLYVLEGKAVYRLNTDWVEVQAGDFMWLRAFCPQACYAGGPGLFRHLLYEDVNRHMPLTRRWCRNFIRGAARLWDASVMLGRRIEGLADGPARAGHRASASSAHMHYRTGPVLPRRSIRGRKETAWPGARLFSRSHIRCQACSPSSMTGTDAVVRGGVM